MKVTAESLAYWYLRLNGFLTIRNFIVHAEWRREGVGTDADIVGARFPFRCEMVRRPLVDDEGFCTDDRRLSLVIAEVKTGQCALNGPWTNPDRQNVQKVLAAIGVYSPEKLEDVSAGLYASGTYEDDNCAASLVAFGSKENAALREQYPAVRQVLWRQVKAFIHQRFANYLMEKAWHQTWEPDGQHLYELAGLEQNSERFCDLVEVVPERGTGEP